MLSVLNFSASSSRWDNLGILLLYPLRRLKRLIARLGSYVLLYEPTHEPRARGYIGVGLITSVSIREDGLVEVFIRSDGLFIFPSPVPFRVKGRLMERGLGVAGKAGIQIRNILKEDFLRIVTFAFGREERVPYALTRAIDEPNPLLKAAEEGSL